MMQVGNYRIVEELARGGMGSVYVAIDETLKREVALKSIRSERRFNAESRVRFLQEARTLSVSIIPTSVAFMPLSSTRTRTISSWS